MHLNNLTEHERRILQDKGTERAFTWQYYDHKEIGTYLCKRCSSPLYRSTDKFDSGCGRPSFDDALPGQVTRSTDADGRRTEITCSSCGGHLGHVFIWEKSTDKNTRHCVNSTSLHFTSDILKENTYDIATLGSGCFRCSQAAFADLPGMIQTYAGYAWGYINFPTYEQVCTRTTWHQQVTQVVYDAEKISYERLLEIFFKIHDPTSRDKQGADRGSDYRSVIFTHREEQATRAQAFIDELQDDYEELIVTEIKPLEKFRIAEGYHQDYFKHNPNKPYCQLVVKPKVEKVKKMQENYIPD